MLTPSPCVLRPDTHGALRTRSQDVVSPTPCPSGGRLPARSFERCWLSPAILPTTSGTGGHAASSRLGCASTSASAVRHAWPSSSAAYPSCLATLPKSLRPALASARMVPTLPSWTEFSRGVEGSCSSAGASRAAAAAASCCSRQSRYTGLRAAAGRHVGASAGGGSGSSSSRIQELYGADAAEALAGGAPYGDEDEAGEDGEAYDDLDDEDEGEGDEEDEEAGFLARSVVQVRTLHRVPNFLRPWEDGHDAESTSSGFVVEVEVEAGEAQPGGRGKRRQLLLVTTAGAVEHARKVEVCRSADDAMPYVAAVAAVCLDLDVALLRVEDPAFWAARDDGSNSSSSGSSSRRGGRGNVGDGGSGGGGSGLVPLQLDSGLPHLRKPVVVAGFPLGGGSLCVTSGVVSRIEVVEYSHSGRALLALQVDAPLNNGGWGGPALCAASGRCVGMAFQKFTSQTWMERYDDAAAEVYAGDGGDEDGGGGGMGDGHEGDGGGGQDYDEDAENIGYLVPAQLLQLVLDDYSRELSHQRASTSAGGAAGGAAAGAGGQQKRGGARGGVGRGAARGARSGGAAGAAGSGGGSESAPLYLDGRPRLGLRYQRMESPALRRAFGLAAGQSGVLATGVDPTGSVAGVVQVHDVLLAIGGRQVANDATTLLRPGQRVLFGHWAAVGNVGGELPMTVLRGGVQMELTVRLRDSGAPFLPVSLGPGRRPQYLVAGPLVFAAFSLPYWYELMAGQQQMTSPAARRQLQSGLVPVVGELEWGMPAEDEGEEVVLLTEVLECGEDGEAGGAEDSDDEDGEEGEEAGTSSPPLAADAACGDTGSGGSGGSSEEKGGVGAEAAAWTQLLQQAPRRLATVNGERVRNLAQLAAAVVAAATSGAAGEGQFLHLGLEPEAPEGRAASCGGSAGGGAGVIGGGRRVVLDAASLGADTRAVLRHHSMAAAMSAELRRRLSTSWPFEANHQAQGASRQRRQQGRRLALSGRR